MVNKKSLTKEKKRTYDYFYLYILYKKMLKKENINNILNDCLPFMPIELNQLISQYACNPNVQKYHEVMKQLKVTDTREYAFDVIESLEQWDWYPFYSFYDCEVLTNMKHVVGVHYGVYISEEYKRNLINIYKLYNDQYNVDEDD